MIKSKRVNLSVVVVLYKKKLLESKTLKCLLSDGCLNLNGFHEILIWDNSPEEIDFDDKNLILDINTKYHNKIIYNHCHHNWTLSKVYNISFDKLRDEATHLCILDDDSSIDISFFESIISTIKKYQDVSLILPQIKHKDMLISPSMRDGIRGKYFLEAPIGYYNNNNLSAINSGMTFSVNYLDSSNFRYDERLKNYGTDDYFMIKFSEFCRIDKDSYAVILDYTFDHDLALSMFNDDSARLIERYQSLLESRKILFENSFVNLFFYSFSIAYIIPFDIEIITILRFLLRCFFVKNNIPSP